MIDTLAAFAEIHAVDFEFVTPAGLPPVAVCMVETELRSGTTIRLWQDELHKCAQCPFDTSQRSVMVSFFSTAELACFLALGWRVPERVLDLYVEFRNMTNGMELPLGRSLLGALAHFRLPGMSGNEKESMRELVLRGGPWSSEEKRAVLEYCETDVDALARLLPRMAPDIDIDRALLRGRYMVAVARMEATGVPLDKAAWEVLSANWSTIHDRVVSMLSNEAEVYDGTRFRKDRFEAWCVNEGIRWPRLASGQLALDDDTFREQELIHPSVALVRELRKVLAQIHPPDLSVGPDARNRTLLSPFSSKTGRNQPSTSRFIFGCPAWFRHLIRPRPGRALGYVDWAQQEFGIAAALSKDPRMQAAYASGDPYLEFAKEAGAVPDCATKKTHGPERERFKTCALGVLFGMSEAGLARRISQPLESARQLLRLHHRTFPDFWDWQTGVLDYARLYGHIYTAFGWRLLVTTSTNDRTICNFPMQANGAEMLRIACCLLTERGIQVCAPIHDALLIEADLSDVEEAVRFTQDAMAEASAIVLDGVTLRSEAKIFRAPDRFREERGDRVWRLVADALATLEVQGPVGGHERAANDASAPTRSISYEGSEQ